MDLWLNEGLSKQIKLIGQQEVNIPSQTSSIHGIKEIESVERYCC
jgi:hypothetical protein